MDNQIIFVIFGVLFCLILWNFGNKYLKIIEKSRKNAYYLQKRKIKAKNRDTDDEPDEVEEWLDTVPEWLQGIADGAKIDLTKIYYGDAAELKKVGDIIQKQAGGDNGSTEYL